MPQNLIAFRLDADGVRFPCEPADTLPADLLWLSYASQGFHLATITVTSNCKANIAPLDQEFFQNRPYDLIRTEHTPGLWRFYYKQQRNRFQRFFDIRRAALLRCLKPLPAEGPFTVPERYFSTSHVG